MSDSKQSLYAELSEAIDKVTRELEILRSPSTIGGSAINGSVVADLEEELRALKEARSNL